MADNKSSWASFLKSIATFSGDLSTLTAPSFILSGTSLLEYSSYWGEHPLLFSGIADETSAEARMLAVARWYISTLKGQFSARHDSVGGEKKPLNPVLGETFHGSWDTVRGKTVLIAEQVSHHPPISAYQIRDSSGLTLQGHNGQKSGFSGRTILVKQIGYATLEVPLPGSQKEYYVISLPQLSLEGLFFGAPYAELTEKSYIVSSTGWVAEHEYSGRGWLSGTKNSIKTTIYAPTSSDAEDRRRYVIEGQWNQTDSLRLQKVAGGQDIENESFLSSNQSTPAHIAVDEQDLPYESRRLWRDVASALKSQDYETASKLKATIENDQRALRKEEKQSSTSWHHRHFSWSTTVQPELQSLLDLLGITASGRWILQTAQEEK